MSQTLFNRRQFIGTELGALAGNFLLPGITGASVQTVANERITVGVIGLGARGFNLLDDFLARPDVQVAALCDVLNRHYRALKWGTGTAYGREPARIKANAKHGEQTKSGNFRGVRLFSDPRELQALKDLDAVVIATPDHWHVWCILEALRVGKDVYCEKPVTHFFYEEQLVYREVAARQAVF
ncbi:MAG TPA: Gfo/Idh/MocA family oxidoreductase [Planctomicrobium sp.]|nr:Gfo/Idh/MocA family oxidoreductase [Planctomicrobium sp.]